jgi:hypothetical protein
MINENALRDALLAAIGQGKSTHSKVSIKIHRTLRMSPAVAAGVTDRL